MASASHAHDFVFVFPVSIYPSTPMKYVMSLAAQRARLVALLACGPIFVSSPPAFAQSSVVTAPDGTGTTVTFDAVTQTYTINGGTQVDANLFHSFQQFGLNTHEIANFLANPNVTNILARVSGGQASVIDGLLQVSGGNHANLFILNPAGVLLGRSAHLNLAGSFSVSSASGLAFGNEVFNAAGNNDYSALTGNPTGYVFLGHEGAVLNEANLAVNPGESLTLAGSTVINTGSIDAPEGEVSIVAMPEAGVLQISQAGLVMSLAIPTDALNTLTDNGITPLDLPSLLAGEWGGNATTVSTLADGTVVLSSGSTLNTESGAVTSTGTVDVSGSEGGQVVFIGDDIALPMGLIDISGTAAGGDLAVYARDDLQLGVRVDAAGGGHALFDPVTLNIGAAEAATIVGVVQGGGTSTQSASETININAPITVTSGTGGTLAFTDENSDNRLTINLNALISLGADHTLTGEGTTVNVNITTPGIVQNGVDVAAAGATVNLGAGTYQEGTAIALNRHLTLNGAGTGSTLLSGSNAHGVLFIDSSVSGNVHINHLTLSDGNAAADGGGILNNANNAPLFLENVIVANNQANSNGGRGGGIFSRSAVSLTNTTVTNNQTNGNGNRGGGIFSIGAVSLANATVANNQAIGTGGRGGGIFSRGAVTLNNSTVSDNQSRGNNGGIFSTGTVTLTHSTVSGNQAGGNSGGIFSTGAIALIDSTVSNNSANGNNGGFFSDSTVSLTRTTVSGNSSGGNNAGFLSTGAATLTDSTVSNNSAGGNSGGFLSNGTVTLNNSTVSNNSAGGSNGGFLSGGALTLNNATVSDNRATGSNGGFRSNSTVTLNNSTIENNQAGNNNGAFSSDGLVSLTRSTVANNSARGNGGGFLSGGAVTLDHSTVANNSAEGNNGGFLSGGAVTLTHSTVANNSAEGNSGGFLGSTTVDLSNSTVSGNSAGGNNGGFFSGDTTTLTNATVSGNSANGSNGAFLSLGAINLNNATIAFNTADADGNSTGNVGGFFINGTQANTIRNSIIANNTDPNGAAPDLRADLSTSTITNSLIQNTMGISAGVPVTGIDGNIIGEDPQLAPLANNGGPTQTHRLMTGSPAIDAGGVLATATDQRGIAALGTRDIGAFERSAPPTNSPAPATVDPSILFNRPNALTVREAGSPILTITPELAAELGILDFVNNHDVLTLTITETAPANAEHATTIQNNATTPHEGTNAPCYNDANPTDSCNNITPSENP